MEHFPSLKKRKELVVLVVCVSLFLMGLSCVSYVSVISPLVNHCTISIAILFWGQSLQKLQQMCGDCSYFNHWNSVVIHSRVSLSLSSSSSLSLSLSLSRGNYGYRKESSAITPESTGERMGNMSFQVIWGFVKNIHFHYREFGYSRSPVFSFFSFPLTLELLPSFLKVSLGHISYWQLS